MQEVEEMNHRSTLGHSFGRELFTLWIETNCKEHICSLVWVTFTLHCVTGQCCGVHHGNAVTRTYCTVGWVAQW